MIYEDLINRKATLAVIGLGYVGLPIALLFAKKVNVIGFDIHAGRVEMMKQHKDPSGELPPQAFENTSITFTADPDDLKAAQFYIVAVPTPIDQHNNPDLTPVIKASETVAKVIKRGDYVVYESTVYPGCTEEDCIPILERSGLKFNIDFKVGYSPERINPGDEVHTLENTVKIVSGGCPESAEQIYKVYSLVITAGLHRASSIKVAEAAKIIENTQRDLNIALMNELSLIFAQMGINTYDVLDAAATKWNFQRFTPGLVGGHCIGVDPYYLTYKSAALGHHAQVILAGRAINDSMGKYVGNTIVKKMIANGVDIKNSKVLIMGITFKENVMDIRNSKVVDVIRELHSFEVQVDVVDPYANADEVKHEYNLTLSPNPGNDYDAVIIAVAHQPYTLLTEDYFLAITKPKAVLADIKGLFRNKIQQLQYWSL